MLINYSKDLHMVEYTNVNGKKLKTRRDGKEAEITFDHLFNVEYEWKTRGSDDSHLSGFSYWVYFGASHWEWK